MPANYPLPALVPPGVNRFVMKCGRCNVGEKYVCKDGPVFSLAELDKLTKEY